MACETAVVASSVGGIPEVVVDGETGLLVRLRRRTTPPASSAGIADAVNRLAGRPGRWRRGSGAPGRERAVAAFAWDAIAAQTVELYRSLR